ncbi:MAG: tol-pal system protein YbgF [Pseudomonadota bacterium]
MRIAFVILSLIAAAPAAAQDLRGDVLRLAEEIEQLKAQNQALSRMTLQTQQLDQQVRDVVGRFDEINFRLRRLEERLSALEAATDRRFTALEAGETATEVAATPPPDPETVLPEGDAEERYAHVFGLLQNQRFDEAEQALVAYLTLHGDSERAPFAKFFLGETFRARGDHRAAAVHFAEGFQAYPDHQRAPDMLLKLGDSLVELGDLEKACGAYDLLTQRFPDAPNNVQAMTERGRTSANCS